MSDGGPKARETRLAWYAANRSGGNRCRTRHVGLCGRRDRSGCAVPAESWEEIHPAFRCAACTWILRGDAVAPRGPQETP